MHSAGTVNPEPLSAHYQIVLTREWRRDEMEVVVEMRPEMTQLPVEVEHAACRANQGSHRDDGEKQSTSSTNARRAEGEAPWHALVRPITT